MRPRNSSVKDYKWHDSVIIDGAFTLVPSDDTKTCVFCHQPAPSSIYYPPLELLHFAMPDIPMIRTRVCNNHYNQIRKMTRQDTFPKPIEEMYGILKRRVGCADQDTAVLPKWSKSFLSESYEWRGASIPAIYYTRFKDWVHEESLLFKGFELRYPLWQRFTYANADIPQMYLTTFEQYLLQPEYPDEPITAASKSTSSTMFD